ncbi:hypothetical protein JG687_00004079 [Phytophthora cactorum]|uniref:Uncharacterized protein n=1 Tax=Phytophthora cactorum TaxID=29920 RepID=A0A8T1USJ1_9STRA|nr:hypothetical protein JG687_00004079 [Phytophthora cactorum]
MWGATTILRRAPSSSRPATSTKSARLAPSQETKVVYEHRDLPGLITVVFERTCSIAPYQRGVHERGGKEGLTISMREHIMLVLPDSQMKL